MRKVKKEATSVPESAAPTTDSALTDSVSLSDAERARRRRSIAVADGSLRLEGLSTTPEADAIAARWERGEITAEEMTQHTVALHGRRA